MTQTNTTSSPSACDHTGGRDAPPSIPETSLTTELDLEQSSAVTLELDLPKLRSWIAAALPLISELTNRTLGRVAILIVDDQRMSELHRQHLGIARTTDVLTFPSNDGHTETIPVEADIAICADEASRRASELGHSVERELLLYAVHGLLHSVGFDDEDSAGFEAIHQQEDRILQAIGVGATFK